MAELGLEGYVGFGTVAIGISGTAKRGKGQCSGLRLNQAACGTERERARGMGSSLPSQAHVVLSVLEQLVGGLFGLGVRMQVYLLSPERISQNMSVCICGQQHGLWRKAWDDRTIFRHSWDSRGPRPHLGRPELRMSWRAQGIPLAQRGGRGAARQLPLLLPEPPTRLLLSLGPRS